jgi:hypothetical protein
VCVVVVVLVRCMCVCWSLCSFLRSSLSSLFGVRPLESPSLVLVINDTKLLMSLCQVN